MANRVTSTDVQKIIDYDPMIADLTPFINAAHLLVDELCVPAGYTEDHLTQIELWLSAHFVAIRDPRITSESIGAASQSYASSGGLNLGSTTYGKQAEMLDIKGGLAWIENHIAQGKRAKVGVLYLGTDPRCRPRGRNCGF